MSAEVKQDHELQIAHILFTDIVGYSKLLSDEQRKLFGLLNESFVTHRNFERRRQPGNWSGCQPAME